MYQPNNRNHFLSFFFFFFLIFSLQPNKAKFLTMKFLLTFLLIYSQYLLFSRRTAFYTLSIIIQYIYIYQTTILLSYFKLFSIYFKIFIYNNFQLLNNYKFEILIYYKYNYIKANIYSILSNTETKLIKKKIHRQIIFECC